MATLPIVSGSECIAAMRAIGYEVVRQKGSHVRLNCVGRSPITVPLHKELDRGTLRSILGESGVSIEQFMAALRR